MAGDTTQARISCLVLPMLATSLRNRPNYFYAEASAVVYTCTTVAVNKRTNTHYKRAHVMCMYASLFVCVCVITYRERDR